MRFLLVCAGAALALAAVGQTAFPDRAHAITRLSHELGPALVIQLREHSWKVPTFQMAGQDAFAVIHVINSRKFSIYLRMKCRTGSKLIRQMSGRHLIRPHETLEMDTRRFHHPMQKGAGVDVNCIFTADGPAKVLAWFIDKRNQGISQRRMKQHNPA